MDMNIQKYLAFLKTLEYGSITKAAEIRSYSQSGVSRMIQDIEKEWGLSLLERSRGGVRLTSDGMKLLPRLILKRIPYRVAVRELDVPAYRDIALVLRNQKTAPLAVKRFLEYLSYR